jgi:hypothetical protein
MQKTSNFDAGALLGFARAAAKANLTIQAANDRLKAANAALPVDQRKPDDQLGLADLYTGDTYREKMVNELGWNYLANDAVAAATAALTKLAGMDPQIQGQVFTMLGLAAAAAADPQVAAELALKRFEAADRPTQDSMIAITYPEYVG